jgi:hypothetical protein
MVLVPLVKALDHLCDILDMTPADHEHLPLSQHEHGRKLCAGTAGQARKFAGSVHLMNSNP